MISYWDTSAAVALFFNEPHTAEAVRARALFTTAYMWSWGRVEMETACLRRAGAATRLASIRAFAADVSFHPIEPGELPAVLALNLRHRLRASDAGHLFCFQQISLVHPSAQLVCFDAELCAAARAAKLRVWPPR